MIMIIHILILRQIIKCYRILKKMNMNSLNWLDFTHSDRFLCKDPADVIQFVVTVCFIHSTFSPFFDSLPCHMFDTYAVFKLSVINSFRILMCMDILTYYYPGEYI